MSLSGTYWQIIFFSNIIIIFKTVKLGGNFKIIPATISYTKTFIPVLIIIKWITKIKMQGFFFYQLDLLI